MSKKDWENDLKTIPINEIQSAIEKAFANLKPLDEDCEYVVSINDIKYEIVGGMSFNVRLSSDFKKGEEPF